LQPLQRRLLLFNLSRPDLFLSEKSAHKTEGRQHQVTLAASAA
jgi:hypothetical protein